MFFAMPLLPTLASGVMPLRLVEAPFLLNGGASLSRALFLPRLILAESGVRCPYSDVAPNFYPAAIGV
jgi:hypothetical protein